MQLQACTRCGAQFDVSGFAAGQAFSCGACGTVLTAGVSAAAAPAGRKPGTARVGAAAPPSAPAPASRSAPRPGATRAPQQTTPGQSPGQGGRQYVPVARDGKGAARAPARGARKAGAERPARSERAEGEPRARKGGVNPLVVGGIVGAIVLGVVGLVVFGPGGDKSGERDVAGNPGTTSGSGPGAATQATVPVESARDIMGEYGTNPPTTKKQWQGYIARLVKLDPSEAKAALTTVYTAYVNTIDGRADDKAHEFLGHTKFELSKADQDAYDDIARPDLEFIRGVQAARNKRWFTADEAEDLALANAALKELREFSTRLVEDPEFAAGYYIRSNLANAEHFKEYNFFGYWASPWLICYSSKERVSEYDLLSIEDPVERKARREELARRRAQYERVVSEKGHMLKQLYAQWMEVFGKPLELKHLMSEYGGRPDYPPGVRSFQQGCPMVMWVFDNRDSWDDYHKNVKKELIPHFAAGYFSGESEMVMLYDEGDETRNRVFEIGKTVHEGVHQLEHFFSRQKNNWRKPPFSQDFLGEGIAEWLGSVKMNAKYELEFVGVNVTRCGEAQAMARDLKASGRGEYRLFPLEFLTSVTNYGMAQSYATTEWQLDANYGMSLFYQQSWAFVHFLKSYRGGKYWPNFLKFVDLMMQRPRDDNSVQPYFRQAFDITGDEDWEDLESEFFPFMRDLLTLDLKPFEYNPPPRRN